MGVKEVPEVSHGDRARESDLLSPVSNVMMPAPARLLKALKKQKSSQSAQKVVWCTFRSLLEHFLKTFRCLALSRIYFESLNRSGGRSFRGAPAKNAVLIGGSSALGISPCAKSPPASIHTFEVAGAGTVIVESGVQCPVSRVRRPVSGVPAARAEHATPPTSLAAGRCSRPVAAGVCRCCAGGLPLSARPIAGCWGLPRSARPVAATSWEKVSKLGRPES